MATLKDFGVPGVGVGIMQPVMAHRWRIVIPGTKNISLQAIRAKIDMLNSEITLSIEQPAGMAQDMLNDIRDLGRREFDFQIHLLDADEGIVGEIRGFAKVTAHEFLLDYAINAVAVHTLKLKYRPAA